MKRLFVALIVSLGCGREAEVPLDRMLWRVEPWVTRESVRTAPATIVIFRSNGEYVEFHGWVIEQPDTSVYISSDRQYVAIVGRWTKDGSTIRTTREQIARRTPLAGADPLCAQSALTFSIVGNSVTGSAGQAETGTYSPVTRLVAPDFQSYVDKAKKSGIACGGASPT